MKNQKCDGFTLIELVLVIGIFALVMGSTSIVLSRFLNNTQLDTAAAQLLTTLRKAQAQAMGRYRDDAWGVYLDPALRRFVLFKGGAFSGSDAAFHEVTALPSSLAFNAIALAGGGTVIVFDRLTGATSNVGSFELTSLNNPEKWQWAIAPNGLMEIH